MNEILTTEPEPVKRLLATDSPKDSKWDAKRGDTQDIGGIYSRKERFSRLAARMAGCSTLLAFKEAVDTDTGEISLKLILAAFCHVRHCPTCSWRRSLRNTARFFAKLPELRERFPKHRWIFLTLTVKNCHTDELRSTIQAMNKAWQRLIQRKDWPADGFVRATEVTRGKDGSAHPHFHCLLMVKPSYFAGRNYVTHEDWANRWQAALRADYQPSVRVQAVKAKREGQTIEAAVVETLKYSTKPEDALADPEWLYTITEQLHKLRFIASGGELKGVLKEDMTDEEMIQGDEPTKPDDEVEPELVRYTWVPARRQYVFINAKR